jgi:predicted nucleic acid-binding protein
MKLDAFGERLARCRKVALDRGTFEVYLRGEARRGPLGLALFERIEAGRLAAVTSVLTLMALLEAPHRAHDEAAAQQLAFLVPTFPNLDLAPVTLAVAERAAAYRARFDLDEASAVLAATAKLEGAQLLVAAEPALKRLAGELEVLLLDDFVSPG